MTPRFFTATAATVLSLLYLAMGCAQAPDVSTSQAELTTGWLRWRGPLQNGTSLETGLPEQLTMDGESGFWTVDVSGRGTPVIANGRVYAMAYEGEGPDHRELVLCLDENTGRKIWEHRFADFLTDVIYYRYAIGSPAIDPETGNVYALTTAGLLNCFSADGDLLWQHSMLSEYGRLTFPNGRTGAPIIDGDLAIVHVPTSGWGPQAPARDRFFAFDKRTGVLAWSSTPGGPPKDASFSCPVVTWENGKRVLFAGLAGGNLVCVNVNTGDPIWRFRMATGGMSSSPVLYKNSIIAIHGKENLDSSAIGRMVSIQRGAEPESGKGPVELDRSSEVWRNDLVAFTSSPVLVGDRLYQTVWTGDLHCVNADTGESLWHEKLAPDQIHASPVWGDGKLYVPMNNGSFYVIRPSDSGPEILQKLQLDGNCLGAPAISGGRIYVHTTEKLYCFPGGSGEILADDERSVSAVVAPAVADAPAPGAPVRLQAMPADVVAQPGDTIVYRARSLDANGLAVAPVEAGLELDGLPDEGVGVASTGGEVRVSLLDSCEPAALNLNATAAGLSGPARLRIVPSIPFSDDFEDATLAPHPKEQGVQFAPPRPYWVGAKLKWEIREREGEKVLAKTLDRPLFQRSMSMIGHPSMSNYTIQADILTDGNRRTMSAAGVVNQRYLILLKGNHQELEVSTNMWVFKRNVKFRWKANKWYRLKARVDVAEDGSGFVRAKAWPRDEDEPAEWTIEVPHPRMHTHGSPGVYGFSPQSRFRVYIDNISVTPNE